MKIKDQESPKDQPGRDLRPSSPDQELDLGQLSSFLILFNNSNSNSNSNSNCNSNSNSNSNTISSNSNIQQIPKTSHSAKNSYSSNHQNLANRILPVHPIHLHQNNLISNIHNETHLAKLLPQLPSSSPSTMSHQSIHPSSNLIQSNLNQSNWNQNQIKKPLPSLPIPSSSNLSNHPISDSLRSFKTLSPSISNSSSPDSNLNLSNLPSHSFSSHPSTSSASSTSSITTNQTFYTPKLNSKLKIISQSSPLSTQNHLPTPVDHPPSCSKSNSTNLLKKTLKVPDFLPDHQTILKSRQWLFTFGLINFDLDEGPDFDNCYPPVEFSNSQMTNIAFSSFPDCANTGSLIFSWRIPSPNHHLHHQPISNSPAFASRSLHYKKKSNKLLEINHHQINSFNKDFHLILDQEGDLSQEPQELPQANIDLYGYVYFSQEKDPTVFRGYNQRSLVLITHLADYAGLFLTLIGKLGPLYINQGPVVLENALSSIATWPTPTPGSSLELPFLNQIYKFAVPLPNQVQILESKSYNKSNNHSTQILASSPPNYFSSILFRSIKPITSSNQPTTITSSTPQINLPISVIWLLWEILVLAEPLIVFGSTPDIVSDVVIHLRNLIRPIPFHGDWRPYITIHDPDFPTLFNKTKTNPATLIGATNPIILTNTQTWPHVLSLTTQPGNHSNHYQTGLSTDRKRHLQKDKNVVKQLELCLELEDYHQADLIIAKHFALLTEQFLQPLQRYFTTLLPVDHAFLEPQPVASFNEELFLKSLKAHTTALEFRSRLMSGLVNLSSISGFYTRFIRSKHFGGWLHEQVDLANESAQKRHFNRLELRKRVSIQENSHGVVNTLNAHDNEDVNGVKEFRKRWILEGKSEGEIEKLLAKIEVNMPKSSSNKQKGRATELDNLTFHDSRRYNEDRKVEKESKRFSLTLSIGKKTESEENSRNKAFPSRLKKEKTVANQRLPSKSNEISRINNDDDEHVEDDIENDDRHGLKSNLRNMRSDARQRSGSAPPGSAKFKKQDRTERKIMKNLHKLNGHNGQKNKEVNLSKEAEQENSNANPNDHNERCDGLQSMMPKKGNEKFKKFNSKKQNR
ncbi:hypothetical protein O181_072692 [Austropuccinia psidii MF-1]|uniref:UDENN domain-containing protein n=1 Tax=Austropuccinia psidii MF-1 TaxID=1389203 RepID=A0A9Q3IAC9_9BASI|nr:hypothetical protein [Austropuccinia psidii MF-1]